MLVKIIIARMRLCTYRFIVCLDWRNVRRVYYPSDSFVYIVVAIHLAFSLVVSSVIIVHLYFPNESFWVLGLAVAVLMI